MAARRKKAAVKEKTAVAKPFTGADKKKLMAALKEIESQVEVMQMQLRDLKSITKEHTFWLIG